MFDWILSIFIGVATAYCALLVFAWLFADAMIFPAPPASYTDYPGQTKLSTADGNTITAVFLPNSHASHVLLFGHGNKMDLGKADQRLQLYRAHGWAVFAYEYPGYGTSTGTPSEAGCHAALAAAYAYLTKIQGIPQEKIVLYGLSLGSGPAVELASHEPVGGLILEGAFLSTFRVLTRWNILPWDRFDNFAKIGRVKAPLLSLHAREDRTVPFFHGQKLYSAHPGPKQHLWVSAAQHNNILETDPAAYWDAMERFRLQLTSSLASTVAKPTA